jgi:hypothetical protein
VAETGNISKIAEILATKLFNQFQWFETGAWNQNWACVRDDHTIPKRKRKKKIDGTSPADDAGAVPPSKTEAAEDEDNEQQKMLTHPSDVVFFYDEPYSLSRTYINTDLKSYKKGSITSGAVTSAIQSLALALECAELSTEWQGKYAHEQKTYQIVGLLFIYNHDGEYDTGFDEVLAKVNHARLRIPRSSRIFVLGPRDIRWLDNVRHDIVMLRGEGLLPPESKCSFYYPDLVRRKKVQTSARAATLEMLTGPWTILAYHADSVAHISGYLVYFRGFGKTAEEFLYLIDHLLHYQMVKEGVAIRIRVVDSAENAVANFQRAVEEYIENYDGGDSELASLLRAVTYDLIPQVKSQFSLEKIGMNRG